MSGNDNPSSFKNFFINHRKLIITTITAGTAAFGAYYYYNQLQKLQPSGSISKETAGSTEKNTKNHDTINNDLNTSSPPPPISKSKKKKLKKKLKKNHQKTDENNNNNNNSQSTSSASSSNSASPILKPSYPLDSQNDPDFNEINKLIANNENLKSKFAKELKNKGNQYFKSKDNENAIKYYEYALRLDQDPVFYSNISACYFAMNQLDKVIESSNKALELKPDYSKALLRRANAYEALGNNKEALYDFSILSLFGEYSGQYLEPLLNRILDKVSTDVLRAKLDNKKTDNFILLSDSALVSFFGIFPPETTITNYNPDDEADKELVQGLEALAKKTSEGFLDADKHFIKANELFMEKLLSSEDNDENSGLLEKVAIALEYSGVFKFLKFDLLGSETDLQKAIDLYPRPNSYIYMAMLVADKNNDKNDLDYFKYFDKATTLNPNFAPTYYHRGQLLLVNQKFDEAETFFLKAKELDDSNVYPYIQLACVAYYNSTFKKCQELFDEARTKFPTLPEVPTFYAEILADKGELEAAMKQYDIAYRLETAYKYIHVGIAPLIGKAAALARIPTQENFDTMTELLEKACELDPRSEQAKISLAQLKLQTEDIDTAIALFEETADLARTYQDKLQATTFAEAAKIQKRIKENPIYAAKIEETLATYRADGII
ncbi:protein channel TOM71 NDAI_0B04340 [Naumovozyma dairenensis CBS 421]|uniref:TOM70 n=1 Tax=Naumovozyma dairenensis (strain ATCC 10597 / BCRC 20456 / CBS 421 / NBRC 0211 / NRRL Y-12639) TaxID=1071378 RepID=G0W6Q7_NAUDC|nr:hypothetical protein NDAI_0B04340 [Naumovozyma dairenensis CBS 421]CCD23468.1 hypothetical protein NDAI_0B04340 [Naumovozyma dairenensis CBS 421]